MNLNRHYNHEFNTVITKANELLKLYPKENIFIHIQGASNAAISKFSEAIKCYEKILKVDSNSSIAYFNIAIMYDSLKLPQKCYRKL